MTRPCTASVFCELMKALRWRWMNPTQIDREGLVNDMTIRKWLPELEANGLVVSRARAGHGGGREFTVAREWGGQAA